MSQSQKTEADHVYDVLVVGMGAAGVGIGVALRHAGIDNFLTVDRHGIGASFERWPDEMRFITPSFPTNSIGMLDINSIAIGASPAFGLQTEHPTGKQYASHLRGVAKFFELPIRTGIDVTKVSKIDDLFHVQSNADTFKAKHVIWAAGDFMYPRLNAFAGSEHCRHAATLDSYKNLDGDDFIIVGGYESGVDAAYNLAKLGKRVRLIDREAPWALGTSDPSVALSTYSLERMRSDSFKERVELIPETSIQSASRLGDMYQLTTIDGQIFNSRTQPLIAAGFNGSHTLVADLFEPRDDGFPVLNEDDESTIAPGLFLVGAAVRHENLIFCFIFKYRQRFAVVAKAIATSLGLPAEYLETYRDWGMYLDDLSCCGEECVC